MAKKKPARKSTGKGKAAKTVSKSKKKSSSVAKTKKPIKAKSSGSKKKSSASKPVASKKKSPKISAVKKGKGSKAAKPKKSTTKSQKKSPSKPIARSVAPSNKTTTGRPSLSAQDRYNAGGLLTCAIDRERDPGSRKLRKALKLLQLSIQEQENLVRLSQGFTIPKLFADEMPDEGIRRLVVKEVMNSVKGEGNYERDWQDDLRQFSAWLGVRLD